MIPPSLSFVSGSLFVLILDPFLRLSDAKMSPPGLGIIRACADGMGAALNRLEIFKKLQTYVETIKNVGNLKLKPPRCVLIPASMPFSPELVDRIPSWLSLSVPSRQNILNDCAKYFEPMFGPGVGNSSSAKPILKWRSLGDNILHSNCGLVPPVLAYTTRVLLGLSHSAQIRLLPKGVREMQRVALNSMGHLATNATNASQVFGLSELDL